MMAMSELDSFIVKFKHLLFSGSNASLTLKSKAGKAEVTLSTELGDVPPPPTHLYHYHRQS